MSELGEYYQDKRAKDQARKEQFRIWNTDVIDGLSVEYGFKVVKHTKHHFSLYHPMRGRMDYWPSTGKHGWFNKNKIYGKITFIPDIEDYLMKHFKPKQ